MASRAQAGTDPATLPWIVRAMGEVFDTPRSSSAAAMSRPRPAALPSFRKCSSYRVPLLKRLLWVAY